MKPDKVNTPLVLVVEDDLEVSRLIQLELELEGFRVAVASTGTEGLELAYQLLPSAIILDGMLPELGGFHVLQKLKTDPNTAKIPVIYVSARINPEEARQAITSGAVRFFSKPFELSELVAEVKAVLGAPPERFSE